MKVKNTVPSPLSTHCSSNINDNVDNDNISDIESNSDETDDSEMNILDNINEKVWDVKASILAKDTFNPIRNILETMDITPHPMKKMISLSIGDPTVFGNLRPAKQITEAVISSIECGKNNGYGPSTGFEGPRQAVADYISVPGAEVTKDDIILCSGCSCALDLCISSMADRGQNILVPRPGFPLYTTLAAGLGIETHEYNLLPDQDWEVDLLHMESLIDHKTAAIVVNSPGNPCGSVFSPAHLRQILAVAELHKLPIIADEIYENCVFPGQNYVPIASLTTTVPVLSCGGLTKRFLVPGWRLGWIVIYDKNNVFASEVRKGLMCMSQRIIGSNTLVQGALPTILKNTPPEFFSNVTRVCYKNAKIAHKKLRATPGLFPVMPSGAMYMMVRVDMDRFPHFETDLQFVEKLVSEQSVFCLPGKCFNYPNYFRIVLTVPDALMVEACDRIHAFCNEHLIMQPPSSLVHSMVDDSSLYATYGKLPGRFVDAPHADDWHSTWALAVQLAEWIANNSRRPSISTPMDSPVVSRKNSIMGDPSSMGVELAKRLQSATMGGSRRNSLLLAGGGDGSRNGSRRNSMRTSESNGSTARRKTSYTDQDQKGRRKTSDSDQDQKPGVR